MATCPCLLILPADAAIRSNTCSLRRLAGRPQGAPTFFFAATCASSSCSRVLSRLKVLIFCWSSSRTSMAAGAA